MLNFRSIALDMKDLIDKYYSAYGDGSCQHSFATSFCLNSKYGDMFCEKDGYLYIKRSNLCTDDKNIYLFPMGVENDDKIKIAIDNVISDAHENNKKVEFNSITEKAKDILSKFYADRFVIEERRDLYEYIYNVQDLAYLEGSKYYNKRNEVRSFLRKYEGHVLIEELKAEDIENVKKLSREWLLHDDHRMEDKQLQMENKALNIVFDNYEKLGIMGLTIYIDDDLAGFIVGVKLNDLYVDAMIEKGNINYKGVYKVLNKEFSRICCEDYKFINLEEDLGVEGLRNMKLLYHPSHYIKKYIAKEI